MGLFRFRLVAALIAFSVAAPAVTFTFDTDPFAGSTALTTPGRQVVGGEPTIDFFSATDLFAFHQGIFGVNDVLLVNDVIANVPKRKKYRCTPDAGQ